MKLFIISLLTICLVYSCGHKNIPTSSTTTTTTTVTEVKPTAVMPPAAPVKTETAEVIAGKSIYVTKCTRCHEAKKVDDWNAQQWVPILNQMAQKARLDATEKANVTAYINFYARNS